MGMMIVSAAAAWMTLATPADGHSVAPIASATAKSEVTCDGPLTGAYLAPAEGGLGVRAPLVGGSIKCKVTTAGASSDVTVDFTDSDSIIGLAADKPVVLGVDTEASLATRGEISRVDGSAGPAKIGAGSISAALPTSHMPQNIVVLGSDSLGNADYAVISLLGKAKVSLKVPRKDSKLEVIVAGHRTTGLSSDKKGKADIAVPSPPGFTDGDLVVFDKKGKPADTDLKLPAAKPLFALAVLGPAEAVAAGGAFVVLAAGADPRGLPAAQTDFSATASTGFDASKVTQLKPGLWRIDGTAGSADGQVTVKLGQASRVVDVKVAAPVAAIAEVKPAETKPAPAIAETKPAETKPAPAVAETKPAETKPTEVASVTPPPSKPPEVKQSVPPPTPASDDGTVRLGIALDVGYMTNTGAISAPGGGATVSLAYRSGSLDFGGALDLLVTTNSNNGNVSVPSSTVTLQTVTSIQTLQAMIGPYARYRFTDLIGVMGQAGLGISRVTESITANGAVNAGGSGTPVGFAALAALQLDFGIPQVFVGARYGYAQASGTLSGPAGGIAGVAGVGINLDM